MEILGTQVKPMPFDPVAAARSGMELANLGLQPLRIAQELRNQAIEERQKLIAEQEAQRNLDFKRYEDQTNRRFGEIVRQFTTKDAKTGKTMIDYEQAFQAALRDPNIEPQRLAAIQEKVLQLRATEVKNVTDFNTNFDKFRADMARAVRGMDEQEAARYIDSQTKLFTRLNQVPAEVVEQGVADFLGIKPGASIVKNAQAVIKALDINEQQEMANKFTETGLAQAAETIRQAGAQTMTGPEARNPGSNVSRAAQQVLLASMGPNTTEAERAKVRTMSAADISNMPGVRELLQANVQPAATRAGQQVAAVDADVKANFFSKLEASAIKVARAKVAPELTPANIIANKFNQALLDDPNVREYVTLIQEANAKGIPIPQDAAGPSSVAQIARGQQQLLKREAEARRTQSSSGRFNTPASEGGVLLRRKSDGQVARQRVPEERARRLLATGQYERVE